MLSLQPEAEVSSAQLTELLEIPGHLGAYRVGPHSLLYPLKMCWVKRME